MCVGYSPLQEFRGFNERAPGAGAYGPSGAEPTDRQGRGEEEEETGRQSEEACEDARDQRADRPDCNP